MTKLRDDLNDFLFKWDKATAEHNRSEEVSEALKPVFIVKEIGGKIKEENAEMLKMANDAWDSFDLEEKKYILENAGYEL